jgi:hypothetical protein
MGGQMKYVQANNVAFLHNLLHELGKESLKPKVEVGKLNVRKSRERDKRKDMVYARWRRARR